MAGPVDPAVRSIRIAATLNDRFRTIMNAPVTPTGGMAQLELSIGEAQQIYPEIWTHLDEARATLAGRGVDTTRFDTVRALEPKGSLGVSRVDLTGVSTSLTTAALGIADEQIKSAQFNLDGHRRANLAIEALQSAMPEVDWKGLERAEAADAAKAAASLSPLGSSSTMKWLAVAAGALIVVYAFWYLVVRQPPRDHKAERKANIVKLRAKLDAAPCDKSTLDYLTSEEYWDTGSRDHTATVAEYTAKCAAQLEVNPCDRAKQTQLRAIAGREAATRFREKCKATGATVPP